MKLNLKNITLFAVILSIVSGCGSAKNIVNETNGKNTENSLIGHEESVSVTENEIFETDCKPMAMIDDIIYVSTGKVSDVKARCGVMDGKITSEAASDEEPKVNNQSNFGIGYGYQYVSDGVDFYMPEGNGENRWIRFEPLKAADETVDYIGISAHVKEVHEDFILISSDTDDFPGVFIIVRPTEKELADVKGGDYIYILMQDLKEKDGQGLPKYLEKNIVVLDEKEDFGQNDILLTDAPVFALIDVLSSQLNYFEIKSENYSWNIKENGKIKSIEKQGKVPPEETKTNFEAKLNLPKYNKTESVIYSFSTVISPDILTVSQWDIDDAGNIDTKKQKVIKYYYKNPLLELEAGKVYKFKAEWKKDNIDRNSFYGTANYVLVTE